MQYTSELHLTIFRFKIKCYELLFFKVIKSDFEAAISKVTEELKKEGFGVLTNIDMKETLKKKLDVDIRKYKILGACNPQFAHQALLAESQIGTMLPCNVVVQERENGEVEISAVDPVASMMAIVNPGLVELAQQVSVKLKSVVENV
ncbi:MAG: DUF302 domain-containing protein [Chitinophagaceae bacterium]